MKLFADASFLVALYAKSDERYTQAHKILDSIETEHPTIVISDYIFDETITLLLASHPHYGFLRAKRFDIDVSKNKICHLVFISDILFAKARAVFLQYNRDKLWSFTDCTSYAVMKDFGITQVLTFDHHFEEMGFSLIQ